MTPGRLFYGFDAETVLDPQPPIAGESLPGWIARTSIENELPHVTTIMRDVGQAHRNRLVDVMRNGIDVDGLAVILGCDVAEVTSRRGENADDGRVRYLGALIRPGDLHTTVRRFSPSALAADATPHYRASWLVRTFPVCPQSWEVLRTACDCGTEQSWATVSALTLCEGCGGDLRELSAERIGTAIRPGLRFLADMLFGDPHARHAAMASLPPTLRVLDPGEVFELALLMARVVDPWMGSPRANLWRDQPSRLARALSHAGGLLPRWPETPWLALAASSDLGTMKPRCRPLKTLHRVLSGRYGGSLAAPIRDDLDRIRLGITLDDGDAPEGLVELNEAERIVRVPKHKIRTARAQGHLRRLFAIRRGEILPAYDRTELEAFASTVDWPGAATVGKLIGLPPYGVEQLCAAGLLEWAKAPIRTLRNGLRIEPRDVDALLAGLWSVAAPLDGLSDPVPLSVVMRGVGGREKPWAAVLGALLRREVAFALGRRGCPVKELFVDAADAARLRSLRADAGARDAFPFAGVVSQADACDILNVPGNSRHLVEPFKTGARRGAWLFDRDHVAALAMRVVTSSELSARHFLQTKTAIAAVRRLALTPVAFGFDRGSAVAAFDAAIAARPFRSRNERRRFERSLRRTPADDGRLPAGRSAEHGPPSGATQARCTGARRARPKPDPVAESVFPFTGAGSVAPAAARPVAEWRG